jgi:hypothetical protein
MTPDAAEGIVSTHPASSTPITFHPALLNARARLPVSTAQRRVAKSHVKPFDILPPLTITQPGDLLGCTFPREPNSQSCATHSATAANERGRSHSETRGRMTLDKKS